MRKYESNTNSIISQLRFTTIASETVYITLCMKKKGLED